MKPTYDSTRAHNRRGTQGEIRRELAVALYKMLRTTHVRDIRIGNITSAVGVSQPNFYNHFKNIKEALVASAEIGWSQYPTKARRIRPDSSFADAQRIVTPIIDFWIENGPSLAWSYHGDALYEPALILLRQRATTRLISAILDCIEATRTSGHTPSAVDWPLWSQHTLSRLDAFGLGYRLMRDYGNISRQSIVDTAALMFLSDLGISPR